MDVDGGLGEKVKLERGEQVLIQQGGERNGFGILVKPQLGQDTGIEGG